MSAPLDREDELLDKSSLLAFIAECDEASAIDSQCADLAKKSWRQRRKEELLSLRELVEQLEGELKRTRRNAGVWSGDDKEKPQTLVWARLAERQVLARMSSKKKNAVLRASLTREVQQAKAFHRAFKKILRAKMPSVAASMAFVERYQLDDEGLIPPMDDEVVFRDLLIGIDEIYADLDNLFERNKLHEIPCPGHRSNTASSRKKGMFLEFVDCYAVPFDLQQVEKAVWKVKTTAAGDAGATFAKYFDVDCSTRLKTVCACVVKGDVQMRITVRNAVRKYVEHDRTVFVTRMLLEPAEGIFSVSFLETTCLLLKRGMDSTIGPTTVMQTHSQVIDRENNSFTRSRWKTTPFYFDGAQLWENAISDFYHHVEDTLLGQSRLLPSFE